MNIQQAVKMAWKSIWGKKGRSALTMLGIIIGIAAVMTIVSAINGGDVPPTVEELLLLLESEDEVSIEFVAPQLGALNAVFFDEQFIFPAGCTVNASTMQLRVWQEAARSEDALLCSVELPINRENDLVSDIRLSRAYAACVQTSWESFDVESEIVETALSLNRRITERAEG